MTTTKELRKLADAATPAPLGSMATRQQQSEYLCSKMAAYTAFQQAANPANVIELLDRIDRLEADASRYQWLRLQCNTQTNLVQYRNGDARHIVPCNSAKDLDDAIDRAMKQQKGTP